MTNKGNFNPFDFPEISKLFSDLLDRLFEESGRGAILIATTLVDDHLSSLIESIFPNDFSKNQKGKLFKYPGQLSSFSAKIELAFAFRLINKNTYDSLNSLRRVRNDAAHSSSKFELHELNDTLKNVYNLGPGLSNFIKEISTKALFRQKIDRINQILEEQNIDEEAKKGYFESVFKDKEKLKIMEEQIPFWELAYGLSFLCAMFAHEKECVKSLTTSNKTIGALLTESNKID
jgi:DNA-binding MltR family transcriptional regulator